MEDEKLEQELFALKRAHMDRGEPAICGACGVCAADRPIQTVSDPPAQNRTPATPWR